MSPKRSDCSTACMSYINCGQTRETAAAAASPAGSSAFAVWHFLAFPVACFQQSLPLQMGHFSCRHDWCQCLHVQRSAQLGVTWCVLCGLKAFCLTPPLLPFASSRTVQGRRLLKSALQFHDSCAACLNTESVTCC